MAGVSTSSLAAAREQLEPRLAGADLSLAQELFGVLGMLDGNAGLRRALTDPSRSGQDKAVLVDQLISGKVSAEASSVVRDLAAERWATPRDIGDALETLAATVVIAVAEQGGAGAEGLERLEDQLRAFITVVGSDHGLQRALSEAQASSESRVTLARKLVPGAGEAATLLITQAVASPRGLKPAALVDSFLELVAARQQRWIADVKVSRPLSQVQHEKLVSGLNTMYGRDLKVNVSIDPSLVGGVRVSIGDEVVDSTVATRLSELRRKLAG